MAKQTKTAARESTSSSLSAKTTGSQGSKPQSSRKGKKSWRKNVNITDIEEMLEDKRMEERLGLDKKDSSDLFFTDTVGDQSIKKTMKLKPLRMDELLKPTSSIPSTTARSTRSSSRSIGTTKHDIVSATKPSRKVSKSLVSQVLKKAEHKKRVGHGPGSYESTRREAVAKKHELLRRAKGGYDLWDDSESVVVDASNKNLAPSSIIAMATKTVTPLPTDTTTGSIDPRKLPSSIPTNDETSLDFIEPVLNKPVRKPAIPYDRPTQIPAVRIAHPGASYKPDMVDHKDAILKAAEVEYDKMDKEERVMKQMATNELDGMDDEAYFEDTDYDTDASENSDASNNHESTTSTDTTKKQTAPDPKRKTRAQRNREARATKNRMQESRMTESKRLKSQLNNLNQIKSNLAKEHETLQQRLQTRQTQETIIKSTKPRRLGKHAFTPAPPEIQLQDELADTLRHLKPEGNLFVDRFKSIQERGLVEPRKPVTRKRRYKIKTTESHDYKRFK